MPSSNAVKIVPEDAYTALKKKRETAEKARDKAQSIIDDTAEEWLATVKARNKALPDGWYVEEVSQARNSFVLYRKVDGEWLILDYNSEFSIPDWTEYDENDQPIFDIQVIPLSEVKW